MDIKEQLKDIKTQLRLSMNGAVSQSMREKGLVYKLNFGVELPRIKMIAEGYEKNHDLAQALWKEEIRECKILAGMLQPIETFYPDLGGKHPEYRNSRTDLYESLPAFTVCSGQILSLDCRRTGVRADLWFPDCRPSSDEERGYDRTCLRRIARPGDLCGTFRQLSYS
jgi:hypothetical protein